MNRNFQTYVKTDFRPVLRSSSQLKSQQQNPLVLSRAEQPQHNEVQNVQQNNNQVLHSQNMNFPTTQVKKQLLQGHGPSPNPLARQLLSQINTPLIAYTNSPQTEYGGRYQKQSSIKPNSHSQFNEVINSVHSLDTFKENQRKSPYSSTHFQDNDEIHSIINNLNHSLDKLENPELEYRDSVGAIRRLQYLKQYHSNPLDLSYLDEQTQSQQLPQVERPTLAQPIFQQQQNTQTVVTFESQKSEQAQNNVDIQTIATLRMDQETSAHIPDPSLLPNLLADDVEQLLNENIELNRDISKKDQTINLLLEQEAQDKQFFERLDQRQEQFLKKIKLQQEEIAEISKHTSPIIIENSPKKLTAQDLNPIYLLMENFRQNHLSQGAKPIQAEELFSDTYKSINHVEIPQINIQPPSPQFQYQDPQYIQYKELRDYMISQQKQDRNSRDELMDMLELERVSQPSEDKIQLRIQQIRRNNFQEAK